jgi:hypothetical protein
MLSAIEDVEHIVDCAGVVVDRETIDGKEDVPAAGLLLEIDGIDALLLMPLELVDVDVEREFLVVYAERRK